MTRKQIKAAILSAGVKNLREFGYPQVTVDNILTVSIYRTFFQRMLEDDENNAGGADVQAVRKELLADIKAAG